MVSSFGSRSIVSFWLCRLSSASSPWHLFRPFSGTASHFASHLAPIEFGQVEHCQFTERFDFSRSLGAAELPIFLPSEEWRAADRASALVVAGQHLIALRE